MRPSRARPSAPTETRAYVATVAVLGASAYAFIFSYVMLFLVDKVTPVKVTAEGEANVHATIHGESAYGEGL